jgi:hypothetical protein
MGDGERRACECVCDDYRADFGCGMRRRPSLGGCVYFATDGRMDARFVHLLGGFMAGIASPCVSPSYMPCQAYALAGV